MRPCPVDDSVAAAYASVRAFTEALCEPLAIEDQVVQTMPDVSPTKWHLAHTTWFFETFVLAPHASGYRSFDPAFGFLFNSYYDTIGRQHARTERGHLSRPTVAEVRRYRAQVDEQMTALLDRLEGEEVAGLVTLGLHHEQQHQELLLMDIKHVFGSNPLLPVYRAATSAAPAGAASPAHWLPFAGGRQQIGHAGAGFAFDNEMPRHDVLLRPYELASRPVSCGEFLAFMDDDGYARPELWLADGWGLAQREGWRAPLYWHERDGSRWVFTLGGLRPIDPSEPVCHVSYYEADAFARWAGARLPTEAEWEAAAAAVPIAGNFVDSGALHPRCSGGAAQLFGNVWEWTSSAYGPYPGFRPAAGSLGEYNGKFMANQMVLRGGCCVSARDHLRPTYRNFFYPHQRWQFGGLRLARDP